MKYAKVASAIALTAALSLSALIGPVYAWQWGAEEQQNYEFNPKHRQEILTYGSQIGANWREELRQSQYAASKYQGQPNPSGTLQNESPKAQN